MARQQVAVALLLLVLGASGCGRPHGQSGTPRESQGARVKTAALAPAPAARSGGSAATGPSSGAATGAVASDAAPVATASGATTAPVTSGGGLLTLDEIVSAEVVSEDLSPGVVVEEELTSGPTVSAAMITVGAGKPLAIDVVFEKDERWRDVPALYPNARWVLESSKTGAKLAEGKFVLPSVCSCDVGADHVEGDVRIAHATTVSLDLPRLDANELLRLFDDEGHDLGTFSLDLGP